MGIRDNAIFIGKCAGGAVVVVGAVSVALPAVGFCAAGVKAGTLAAGLHATIGNVAAGSAFAIAQSAGAAGLATGTKFALGTIGAVAASKFA